MHRSNFSPSSSYQSTINQLYTQYIKSKNNYNLQFCVFGDIGDIMKQRQRVQLVNAIKTGIYALPKEFSDVDVDIVQIFLDGEFCDKRLYVLLDAKTVAFEVQLGKDMVVEATVEYLNDSNNDDEDSNNKSVPVPTKSETETIESITIEEGS